MGTKTEDLTARAKELIAERRYAEAVRICRRLLLSRPDELGVRLLLGMALLAQRRYDEVRVEMLSLLRIAPNEAAGHRLLGEAYLRAGQLDRARQSLQRALDLDPRDNVSADLLGEAADEDSSPSLTINRWFDPSAQSTDETRLPEEDEDPPTAIAGTDGRLPGRASIHDPGIYDSGHHTGRMPSPRPPERRSSIPPPPRSQIPTPGSAGPPRGADRRVEVNPSSGPAPRPVSAPRPSVAGGQHNTMELGLEELDSIEDNAIADSQPGIAPLESEPTQARPGSSWPPAHARPPGDPIWQSQPQIPVAGSGRPAWAEPLGPSPWADAPQPSPHGAVEGDAYRSQDHHHGLPFDHSGGYDRGNSGGYSHGSSSAGYNHYPADGVEDQPTGDFQALPEGGGYEPLDGEPTRARREPSMENYDALLEEELTHARAMPDLAAQRRSPDAGRGYQTPSSTHELPHVRSDSGRPQTQRRRKVKRGVGSKRWLLIAAIGGGAFLVIGTIAFFAVRAWLSSEAEEALRQAIQTACDDGLPASLDDALAKAEDRQPGDAEETALRARLHAYAILEHSRVDHREVLDELLRTLDREGAALADARVAIAFVKLSEGDAAAAREGLASVSDPGGAGATAPEVARVRALASAAMGDTERALADARAAVSLRPEAPRHLTLFALVTALNGDASAALQALDGVRGGERLSSVRVTRARVLQESGRDPIRAVAEAAAVIEDLEASASPPELAWAHLVRARQAAATGDSTAALSEGRAAAAVQPPGDEQFGLMLAQCMLQAGAAAEAQEQLGRLPENAANPEQRARITAEVAIGNNDLEAADAALRDAGTSPTTAFLRGRVAESRDQLEEARRLYEQASADPREFVRARARLGAIELGAGRVERAVELLDAARERAPGDLNIVPMLVRARLLLGQIDEAESATNAALALEPDALELLVARARVQFAKGDAEATMQTLGPILQRRANDADLHVLHGLAARKIGRRDVAAEAFTRAAAIDERFLPALIGLAQLALDEGDTQKASEAIDRAADIDADSAEVKAVRVQLMVLQGAGQLVIEDLTAMVEGSNDSTLWATLGRAQTQAERDNDAERSFRQALRFDGDNVEAHLGLALVETRAGALSRAAQSIGAAERGARTKGVSEEFSPAILVARARLRFELGDFSDAQTKARQAIEADPRLSIAHLLLANIEIELGRDPSASLREAVQGRVPPPEALGRLAIRLASGDEACRLAQRYMETAPRGYDAPQVRPIASRCQTP